jgi:hypothetical protein
VVFIEYYFTGIYTIFSTEITVDQKLVPAQICDALNRFMVSKSSHLDTDLKQTEKNKIMIK